MPNPLSICLLIDLNDPHHIRNLATELKVSDEAVIAAAKAVGCMPKAIQFFLISKSRLCPRVITIDVLARYDLLKMTRRPKRASNVEP